MKKLFFYFSVSMLAFAALSYTSCKDDKTDDPPTPPTPTYEYVYEFDQSSGVYYGIVDEYTDVGIFEFSVSGIRYLGEVSDTKTSVETEDIEFKVSCYAGSVTDTGNILLSAGTYNPAAKTGDPVVNTFELSATSITIDNKAIEIESGSFEVLYEAGNYTINITFTTKDETIECSYTGELDFQYKHRLETIYFGNALITFTGGFTLDFYNYEKTNDDIVRKGVQIMAFMPMADDVNHPVIQTGTYRAGFTHWGIPGTFEVGNFNNLWGARGSYSYTDSDTNPALWAIHQYASDGIVEIAENSDGSYKISVNFDTIDPITEVNTDKITFEYEGGLNLRANAAEYITLPSLNCSYYGDDKGNGKGYFDGKLSGVFGNQRFGIVMEGFMNLLDGDLKFEEGTYTVASTGKEFTLIPGAKDGQALKGTYFFFNDETGLLNLKPVMITGGTMTVEDKGDGVFRVTTDFSGVVIDSVNGDREVDNIKLEFENEMTMANKVPGPKEEYFMLFNNAKFKHEETTDTYTKVTLNFYASGTEDGVNYMYTLGFELFIDPVADVDNITLPGTTFEVSEQMNVPGTFFNGVHNYETERTYGSCMVKVNMQSYDMTPIIITSGSFILSAMGPGNYMLMPFVDGTNIATYADAEIRGSYTGAITQVQSFN